MMSAVRFACAMAASLLPSRQWDRLPPDLPIERGAFASGVLTWMIGLAIGIPGFLAHARLEVVRRSVRYDLPPDFTR